MWEGTRDWEGTALHGYARAMVMAQDREGEGSGRVLEPGRVQEPGRAEWSGMGQESGRGKEPRR